PRRAHRSTRRARGSGDLRSLAGGDAALHYHPDLASLLYGPPRVSNLRPGARRSHRTRLARGVDDARRAPPEHGRSAGRTQHRPGLVQGAAIGLGVSTAGAWFLRTISTRVQRRFRDRVTIALESHVARLQASIATIAHQERPEYLDRLSMLRNQVFVLDHMYMSLSSTLGWILRLGVTMALLASIHPALLLLAVFAVPTVLTSTWRPEVERSAQER